MPGLEAATRRRLVLAAILVVAAAAAMAVLIVRQSFPPVAEWAVFALAFLVLEWRSVQLEGAFGLSPSIMVTLTAAVVFDPGSAVLGVAVFEGVGALSRRDIEDRRWFEPLVNISQMILSTSVGVGLLALLRPEQVTHANIWQFAVLAPAAAVVYGFVNFQIVAAIVRRDSGVDIRRASSLVEVHLPYVAMGSLGGFLGVTYALVGVASLPFVFLVFMAGDGAIRAFADLRAAHEEAVTTFRRALEAKDLFARNLTSRTAALAVATAERLGLDREASGLLERASIVAGISRLAVPQDLYHKKGPLAPEEFDLMRARIAAVEGVLRRIECLYPSVEVAAARRTGVSDDPALAARVLSVAEAYSAMTSVRSFRPAMESAEAIDELRRNAGTQFDHTVVDALVGALGSVEGELELIGVDPRG